ncbi:MAG: hypothetical protein AB7I04_20255 [Pseudomonadales bacterium]
MTGTPSNPALLWDRLITLADAIDQPGCTGEDLGAALLSIEEGFSDMLDPADHYPEYVAVLFCRALRRRIERAGPGA